MLAPNYILTELRAIDRRYFAIFNEDIHRWQVRQWRIDRPQKYDLRNYDQKSANLMNVAVYNDRGQDVGYRNIDSDVVLAIRMGRKNGENLHQTLYEIDENNAQLALKADLHTEDVARHVSRDIYGHYRYPRVGYGG
jgi:hypothetical protein